MNKRGFTLTELLITAMVMGLAVTSIFTFFYNMNYTFQSQEHAADLQQQARYAIQRMEWLIKQAGSGDAKGMTVVSGINGVPNDSLSFKITRGPKTMILDNKFWPSNNKIKVLNAKGFKPKQQVSMIDLMSDMYR